MARIIEGERRIVQISTDDVIAIVRNYQKIIKKACCYDHVRELLDKETFYIPEEK